MRFFEHVDFAYPNGQQALKDIDLQLHIIAHRSSTTQRADRIIFLEDGKVKDIGDRDALMADPNGSYRRFVELQGG